MSIHAKHWHRSEISSKIHVLLYLDDDERFLQNLYVRHCALDKRHPCYGDALNRARLDDGTVDMMN